MLTCEHAPTKAGLLPEEILNPETCRRDDPSHCFPSIALLIPVASERAARKRDPYVAGGEKGDVIIMSCIQVSVR
jgi:hypothetical protein